MPLKTHDTFRKNLWLIKENLRETVLIIDSLNWSVDRLPANLSPDFDKIRTDLRQLKKNDRVVPPTSLWSDEYFVKLSGVNCH